MANRPMSGTRAAVCAAVAAALCGSRDAHAQFIHRLSLTSEHTLGPLLSSYTLAGTSGDRTDSGGLAYRGTLGLSVDLTDAVALQVSAALWALPSELDRFNVPLTLTAGVNLWPRVGSVGRVLVSADAGYAFVGSGGAPTFGANAGFLFQLTDALAVGPVIRYAHILDPGLARQNGQPQVSDLNAVSGGVYFRLHIPEAPPPPPPRDTDRDGVIDPDDLCRTTPQGEHPDPDRAGCPLGDRDGDGIFDRDDPCPLFPPGDVPDPARRGCPDDDNDGDGLTDHRDLCPSEPFDPNPDASRPGCREAVRAVMRIPPIQFETDSAEILPTQENRAAVASAFGFLRAHPEWTLVGIEGHTDERDSNRHNLRLSRDRAESVRAALTALGIDAARMVAAGYGEECPVAEGHDEPAWSQNRRVTVVLAMSNGQRNPEATFGCAAGSRFVPTAFGGAGETVTEEEPRHAHEADDTVGDAGAHSAHAHHHHHHHAHGRVPR